MKDTSVIPHGMYCYTIEKVETTPTLKIQTKVCPYWSFDPGLLWDQVKECGVNTD